MEKESIKKQPPEYNKYRQNTRITYFFREIISVLIHIDGKLLFSVAACDLTKNHLLFLLLIFFLHGILVHNNSYFFYDFTYFAAN
jgi:hypothetical protein